MTHAPPVARARTRSTVAGLYALFAALSTAVNLGAQAVVLHLTDAVALALLVGTVAGLPVKYVLDKRYIFGFHSDGVKHDGVVFVLYTGMSVLTTVVFWLTEWVTHVLTDSRPLTLLGGAVGLVVGYVVKYQLDARYVFVSRTPDTADTVDAVADAGPTTQPTSTSAPRTSTTPSPYASSTQACSDPSS